MVKYIRVILVGILVIFGASTITNHHQFDSNKIYYDNVRYSDNVDFFGVEGTNLNYSGNLSHVGDYYELYFDVVNDSGADVVVQEAIYHEDDSYIRYELSYEDGSSIQAGDLLKSGEVKTIHYKVFYQSPIEDNSYELDSSLLIQFGQNI